MPSKSYPCTPEKFAQIRQDLAGAGVTLVFTSPTQNTGSFNPPDHSEITLGFAYLNGTLTLTILHEAWYESADDVWDGLAPYLS
jgi:hypothetical protein